MNFTTPSILLYLAELVNTVPFCTFNLSSGPSAVLPSILTFSPPSRHDGGALL